MRSFKTLLTAFILAMIGSLVACGGGGGNDTADGGVGSGGTGSSVGTVQVAVTDGPAPEFDHVWITIKEIRFHASSTAGPDDSGWQNFPLASTSTIDLAQLDNGALASVINKLSVPTGTYAQIRIVLAGDSEKLTLSAQNAGLSYNDQVDYTDSSNKAQSTRLEIPSPAQGISILGTFNVTQGGTLRLVFDFNIGDDVVKFSRGGVTGFTLKPLLHAFDLDHSGLIKGQLDTGSLTSAGAYSVIVKAEQVDGSGKRYTAVRSTTIDDEGNFTLYPFAIPTGSTSTTADIVIHGRNMDTLIIKNVPVTQGAVTTLTQHAITVSNSGEYTANLKAGTLTPTCSWVEFFQTLPGTDELPHEIHFQHGDPYSGDFADNLALSDGPLQSASYSNGQDLSFTSTAAAEGSGSFLAYGYAPGFTHTPATSTVAPPASGNGPVLFTIPALQAQSGVTADSLSGTITQAANTYDSGYLVITHSGLIATTLNLSSVLSQNGGTGGSYSVSNLAGGSTSSPLAGSDYYGYVVVWNSAHPVLTLQVEALSGFANLSEGNATGFGIVLQ